MSLAPHPVGIKAYSFCENLSTSLSSACVLTLSPPRFATNQTFWFQWSKHIQTNEQQFRFRPMCLWLFMPCSFGRPSGEPTRTGPAIWIFSTCMGYIFPGFRIGIDMVQNYAWTHRNPARYHSTTRLIISNYNSFVFLCFGNHWKSGVFAFFFSLWSRCSCFPVGRFGCPGPALHGDSCQVSELATRSHCRYVRY